MDHLLGKVSQSRAVCGRTVSLHPNPNDAIRTTYQYFRSRVHRFVHVVRCYSPKANNTFASSPKSPMIFRTGAGDSLINVGVAWILSLKTRRGSRRNCFWSGFMFLRPVSASMASRALLSPGVIAYRPRKINCTELWVGFWNPVREDGHARPYSG